MENTNNSTQTPVETTETQVQETKVEEKVETAEEKTYSQKEYDNALAKLRKSYEKKISNMEKKPILEQALIENGCKKEAISDFLKLNKDLYDCVDTDELKTLIKEKSKQFSYMFESKSLNPNALEDKSSNPDKETQSNLEKYKFFFGK